MAHSYSRWSTFDGCAARYKFRYLDQVPEPKSPAMARGTLIHESVEMYLRGHSELLHPDIHENYGQMFHTLRAAGAAPEERWSLTAAWAPAEWADGYLRGVLDVSMPESERVKVIYELKTGKMYGNHREQQELYAVAALALNPDLASARVVNLYLDMRQVSGCDYTREQAETVQPVWTERFREMDEATEFIPSPSYACRFCHFRRSNGGPCPLS